MIDAKLKGEGIGLGEPAARDRRNVIDLMVALKKSLGQPAEAGPATPSKPAKEAKGKAGGQTAAKAPRKRA